MKYRWIKSKRNIPHRRKKKLRCPAITLTFIPSCYNSIEPRFKWPRHWKRCQKLWVPQTFAPFLRSATTGRTARETKQKSARLQSVSKPTSDSRDGFYPSAYHQYLLEISAKKNRFPHAKNLPVLSPTPPCESKESTFQAGLLVS